MSELTIGQLIKIIIGALVVVAVLLGLYFFFKDYILDFFKNMGGAAQPAESFLRFLK